MAVSSSHWQQLSLWQNRTRRAVSQELRICSAAPATGCQGPLGTGDIARTCRAQQLLTKHSCNAEKCWRTAERNAVHILHKQLQSFLPLLGNSNFASQALTFNSVCRMLSVIRPVWRYYRQGQSWNHILTGPRTPQAFRVSHQCQPQESTSPEQQVRVRSASQSESEITWSSCGVKNRLPTGKNNTTVEAWGLVNVFRFSSQSFVLKILQHNFSTL